MPYYPPSGGSSQSLALNSYLANNWYWTNPGSSLVAGSNTGIGTIVWTPFVITQTITLAALGIRVSAGSAGNMQLAIYANSGGPMGNALVSTASMSTAAAANVSQAAVLQLTPNVYWGGVNIDNVGMTWQSYGGLDSVFGNLVGGSSQAILSVSNTSGAMLLTTASAFNTWPNNPVLAQTGLGSNKIPAIQFQVGSVP